MYSRVKTTRDIALLPNDEKHFFSDFFLIVLHFHLSLYQYKGDFQTTHTQNHVFTNRTGRKTLLSVHFYVLPVFWVQMFPVSSFFPPIPLFHRHHYDYEPITNCAKPLLALSPKAYSTVELGYQHTL